MTAGRGNMRTGFEPAGRRKAEHRAASLVAGLPALRGTAERPAPPPRAAREGRRIVMGLNVEDVIAGLDPAERRKVEELAAEFISEEMTLRELRKARHLTQVSVARELGVSQDAVSRMEQRSDLLLSTLRRTVEAMGGSLSLIARFPDRPPVELAGIAERESRD